jgi:hypothetical protein
LISPGDTVPDFEAAMNKLKINELTPCAAAGWHLIVVTERRTQDITTERQRDMARGRCASASPKSASRNGSIRDSVRRVQGR